MIDNQNYFMFYIFFLKKMMFLDIIFYLFFVVFTYFLKTFLKIVE